MYLSNEAAVGIKEERYWPDSSGNNLGLEFSIAGACHVFGNFHSKAETGLFKINHHLNFN